MGINFSKVAFTYDEKRKQERNEYVLKDVDLKIDSNDEFICVLGHTGSGKSTLMQLLNCLIIPTVGTINVDGKVIDKRHHDKLKDVRRKVGLVFQFPEYQLFEETVLKDVAFGPTNFKLENPEQKAIDALKLFNLSSDFYEKNPFLLSGGEMRKVAISGIIASDPEVLILDEPTVGLDPITKKELVSLLKKINKETHKSIIIVTHDMDVVWDVAKRVIVIDDNEIVYDGSKVNLFKNIDFIKSHSLDLPEQVKLLKELKNRMNLDIDEYSTDINSVIKKLEETL